MKRIVLFAMLMAVALSATANHWAPNPGSYDNTATMIGVLQIDGVEQSLTTLEVGAFCGDECRGSAMPILVSQLNRCLLFMTLYGNDGDVLDFRLYDHALGQESDLVCASTLTLASNATYGSGESPYVLNFEAIPFYNVTATANPRAGGSVTGAGSFMEGLTCTLTATPATGYSFVDWTEDGATIATTTDYTFTVTSDRSLVANFSPHQYEIAATAQPVAGGTVEGAGTYSHGATATLTATPATGYSFTGWSENGQKVSTNATYTFRVTGARSLVANFSLNSYYIVVLTDPMEGGTVTGVGLYDHGATATLTATAAASYSFINWTENGEVVSTEASYSFTVTKERTLTAHFGLSSYEIAAMANPSEGGSVNGAGTYPHGTLATLSAAAATGYVFGNWTENGVTVSTDSNYTFTVTAPRNLTANFVFLGLGGHWTPDPSMYAGTATMIGVLQIDGVEQAMSTLEVGAFSDDQCRGSAVPVYVPRANRYLLFMSLYGDEGDVLGFRLYDHDLDQESELVCASTVTFAENATFGSGASPYVLNFEDIILSHSITATANPVEYGTVTGAGTYNHGTTATLTATPATGYAFVNWTEDGEEVSTEAAYLFTVLRNRSLVANFILSSYEITATANPSGSGTIAGTGTYNHGATATLTAEAATGYTFVNWTEDGEEVSINPTYLFTVTGARTLVANYSPNDYEITVVGHPMEGGSVTGAGTYTFGTTATLTATAVAGYSFANWTESGVVVSTEPAYTFTVSGARELVANFTPDTHFIVAMVDPVEGGTVTGVNAYGYGSTATLVATAASGYTFARWTENGEAVCTDATYSFTVTGDRTLTAHFIPTGAGNYWTTTPSSYASTATLLGVIQINGVEQASETLEVGAFCDEECRGSGMPVYVPQLDRYLLFMTLYGNDDDMLSFRLYDHALSQESDLFCPSTVSFAANATFGSGESPYILNFLESFVINASANPTEGGMVDGAGTYYFGTSSELTATANEGYTFINWTEDGEEVSTDLTYVFTVTGERSLVANFSLNSYEITAEVNPVEGGTVTGTGTYNHFDECSLTATANEGYTFVNWTENGEEVSTDLTYVFTVTGERSLVANFSLNSYEITAEVNTTEGGTVTGTGTYNHFDECELTATANEGYTFVNWTENGEEVSTDLTYVFTVTSDRSLVANFVETITPATNHWTPQSSTFAFNMTLTGVIQINGVEQTSDQLEVGAFCGDECRGSQQTYYFAPVQRYIVQLIIYGETGDMISFRLYDHATEQEIDLVSPAPVAFNADGYGSLSNPYVLNFSSFITQTTALTQGWNWWGTYIELAGNDGLSQLENSLGEHGLMIKSRENGFAEPFSDGSWYGNLTSLCNEQMYMIRTDADCEASVTGQPAIAANHPITLNPGWTWIGFPSQQPMSVGTAMSGITPEGDDIVKGRNGYATYYAGDGNWYGTLNTLEPGQGYMYQSLGNEAKTLVYNTNRSEATRANVTPKHNMFKPYAGDYASNMTLTAVVELNGHELRQEGYELAAFVGDECRGSVKLLWVAPLDRYVSFLTVFGEQDETMTFRLTDGTAIATAAEKQSFTVDATLGTLTSPVVLRFGNLGIDDSVMPQVSVYPNPSDGVFQVEGTGIERVEVYNTLGQRVFMEETKADMMSVDLRAQAEGLYTLRVVTANGVSVHNIVKR